MPPGNKEKDEGGRKEQQSKPSCFLLHVYLCSPQKCCCKAEGHHLPPVQSRLAPLHSAAEETTHKRS